MRPDFCANIMGSANRVSVCQPNKFASKIDRRAFVGKSSTAAGIAYAPLLKSTSSLPPDNFKALLKPVFMVFGFS